MAGSVRFFFAAAFLFFAFGAKAATFTAAGTGGWSTPGTWTRVGADADGIPDSDDDVIINSNVVVTLAVTNNSCRSFTISAGSLAMNNNTLRFYGNLGKTGGSITGNGSWNFYANPGTISGTFTNNGNWYFTANSHITITAGSIIQKNNGFSIYAGAVVTNLGTVRFTGGGITFLASSASWVNGVNSLLQVTANFSGPAVLNFTANPNTMIYNASAITNIRNVVYHNLTVQNSGASIPTWGSGALTINNNFTIGTNTTVNCSNQNINVGGNWTNNANTNLQNMATVNLTGSGTQTITRTGTERFNNLTHSGSGDAVLGCNVNITGNFTNSAGTFDVEPTFNYSMTIGGNFTDDALFISETGRVTFNGTLPQTIASTVSTLFYDILSSNTSSVTVATGSIVIDGVVDVSSGSFGSSGAGQIVIPAYTPTSYGRVGDVAPGATLTGSWSVQAFIFGPATAYWQYLSSPIIGNTIGDWDADPRFYMSGVGGNDGNACCPIFRSVRTYNTATNTYTNITSINHVIVGCKGYMVWMSDNMNSLTSSLVYDSKGTPRFGAQSITVTAGGAGGGYNLVGNPYAAPVKFSNIVAASGNLNANFMILQENGNYVTNPNGGNISPNQGFMCIATSTGSMNFTESCKIQASAPNIIRMGDPENMVRIEVSNDVNGLGGQTVVQLNNDARNGYDVQYDLPYLASPYELASNLWTTDAESKDNILNCLDANADALDIPLTVKAGVAGNQLLSFRGISKVTAYSCAWIEDTETGERINLRDKDTYSYYSEAGQERRFTLHFDRTGNNCLLSESNLVESLDAQTQVYVSNDQLMARFNFTEQTDVQVVIYDAEGREAAAPTQYSVSSQSVLLTTPGAHGVYFVQVIQGERVSTKKIVY